MRPFCQASSDNAPYQRGETFLISFTVSESSGGSTFYLVQSGEMNVTRSESDRVEGTFSLQAESTTTSSDGTPQSQQSITITGAFRNY